MLLASFEIVKIDKINNLTTFPLYPIIDIIIHHDIEPLVPPLLDTC